ncbi:hypothetical protein BAY1663_03669 [Pseudomonas sp. BAY1663]|nr:hypothetical protein BAY1663_03669 [Pseudomonas sp. BAY1663]
MGDGAAERRLRGFLGVDVDELVVAGAVGELVDALLVDGEPGGAAQLLADMVLELCDGYLWHAASGVFLVIGVGAAT